ncbi:LLM class flavin-dependent oxidoreductase [Mangrovicoccus sp. HB161399]|uniref:LLM class flavin-dependent oxidoreductase n=1 Tax=Mangrovicoccus sp. HB161399 TaxID=2720392 RepID=UPI001556DADF|nr:LLM class flavin-dependent oxidoreductase [Mangrovicoccus sp. HB161399]
MTPRFGLMDQGWAAPGTTDAEMAEHSLALIRLADEMGFDSCWLGEHHRRDDAAAFYGRFPVPEILLAKAAGLTRRVRLGTGVKVLSHVSPQRAAEEMAMLSLVSGGRVDFGIGLGSGAQNAIPDRAAKIARFAELLDGLLAEFAGLTETPLSPAPGVDLVPRLWAAGRDEGTIAMLAARGINLVVGQAETGSVQAGYVRRYRRSGGRGLCRGVRLVFVAPTDAEALADSAAAADLYFSMMSKGAYTREAIAKGIFPEVPRNRAEQLDMVNVIAGSPETVAGKLNAYIAETGIDQLDAMVQIPHVSLGHAERTLRLLASEVRPRLKFPATEPATT